MDYHHKYIKYKTKYLNLKQESNNFPDLTGGAKKSSCGDEWCKKVAQRKKELQNMRSTKSYIPKDKLSSRDKIYYTENNDSRPFKVIANNTGIHIYKGINNENYEQIYDKLTMNIKSFQGYWDGFDSTPNKKTGNSLLVKITDHKYIFIGGNIFQFTTNDKILDYVSPLGPNDVSYPVAFGTEYVYFMVNNKMIKNNDLETPITIANAEDIYFEFYGHIGSKKGTHHKYAMKNVKILK